MSETTYTDRDPVAIATVSKKDGHKRGQVGIIQIENVRGSTFLSCVFIVSFYITLEENQFL